MGTRMTEADRAHHTRKLTMNEPPKVDLSKSRSCVSCVRVKPLSMGSSMLSDVVRGLLDAFGIVTEVVEVVAVV